MPFFLFNYSAQRGPCRGNPAYNASKAAVKSLTEGLAHELRNNVPTANVTAHLFVYVMLHHFLVPYLLPCSPGWTWTGMTGDKNGSEKPAGAWTAQETVLYMVCDGVCPLWDC